MCTGKNTTHQIYPTLVFIEKNRHNNFAKSYKKFGKIIFRRKYKHTKIAIVCCFFLPKIECRVEMEEHRKICKNSNFV